MQEGAPLRGAMRTQEWLGEHCLEFTDKDSRPPNSPDLNLLDCCVWGSMLEELSKLNPKPQNTSELNIVLQTIWDKLPDETIRKAIIGFHKRLNASISASGAHFEH